MKQSPFACPSYLFNLGFNDNEHKHEHELQERRVQFYKVLNSKVHLLKKSMSLDCTLNKDKANTRCNSSMKSILSSPSSCTLAYTYKRHLYPVRYKDNLVEDNSTGIVHRYKSAPIPNTQKRTIKATVHTVILLPFH